jgi:hypothetical protein
VKETMVWPHAQFQIVQGSPADLTSFDLAAHGSKNVEEEEKEELIRLQTQLFEELQQFNDTGSGGNDGKRAI